MNRDKNYDGTNGKIKRTKRKAGGERKWTLHTPATAGPLLSTIRCLADLSFLPCSMDARRALRLLPSLFDIFGFCGLPRANVGGGGGAPGGGGGGGGILATSHTPYSPSVSAIRELK